MGLESIGSSIGIQHPIDIQEGTGSKSPSSVNETTPLLGTVVNTEIDGEQHVIGVGDGQARGQALQNAQQAKGFFAKMGEALTSAMHGIVDFFSTSSREARLDKVFAQQNAEMLHDLGWPVDDSILQSPGVLARLEAHAKATGSPMTQDEIIAMVSSGERISRALTERGGNNGGSPLDVTVSIDQPDRSVRTTTHQVESGIYTTRALTWYMMAQAAKQDSEREIRGLSHGNTMPTNGSFVMKDPGNRIYQFMAQAPTSTSRMSTHFAERTSTTEQHKIVGLIPSGKPSQRGIEDFRGRLPGMGGTVLFDKLQNEELFVKLESGGCPPYFGGREKHEGLGTQISRFLPSLARNVGHALSFLNSRGSGSHATGSVLRQEHVYKGMLKDTVYTPMKALLKQAQDAGIITKDEAKVFDKGIHKFGMPQVTGALRGLEDKLDQARRDGKLSDAQARDLGRQIQGTRAGIDGVMRDLGHQSDRFGIERRGAEVHIDMSGRNGLDH
jgi:hypothetical protein